jgi:DNA-binding Xre family transcriptional regulator
VAPAAGDGGPRHVLHHRLDRAAGLRDITLSSSQVYRLVTDRPERLSLKILMALLDILDCTMDDLIEPVPAAGAGRKKKAGAGGGSEAGVGELRPRRAVARR